MVVLPCTSTYCRYGARCGFSRGYPECICPVEIDCPLEDNPVCGSDGRRYRNPCVMEARACQMRKDVTIVEFGDKCGTKKILPTKMTLVVSGVAFDVVFWNFALFAAITVFCFCICFLFSFAQAVSSCQAPLHLRDKTATCELL